MDEVFWESLGDRLVRMASAGQLDAAPGPARARYRLPQMNRLDTMALMATWQLQQQEQQATGRSSAHSEARQQVRFNASQPRQAKDC